MASWPQPHRLPTNLPRVLQPQYLNALAVWTSTSQHPTFAAYDPNPVDLVTTHHPLWGCCTLSPTTAIACNTNSHCVLADVTCGMISPLSFHSFLLSLLFGPGSIPNWVCIGKGDRRGPMDRGSFAPSGSGALSQYLYHLGLGGIGDMGWLFA